MNKLAPILIVLLVTSISFSQEANEDGQDADGRLGYRFDIETTHPAISVSGPIGKAIEIVVDRRFDRMESTIERQFQQHDGLLKRIIDSNDQLLKDRTTLRERMSNLTNLLNEVKDKEMGWYPGQLLIRTFVGACIAFMVFIAASMLFITFMFWSIRKMLGQKDKTPPPIVVQTT